MKNKKKKGFTLIELLAIIVILAIIAVITVPIILNIIENSRKGAATDSAYGYKDSVNKWYVSKLQEDNQFQLASSYTISSDGKLGDIVIPVSGDKPSGGYLNYSNNTLTGGCLVFGDYAVTFDSKGKVEKTEKGSCPASGSTTAIAPKVYADENSTQEIDPANINTGSYITIGDGDNINEFFALAAPSNGKVLMLSRYNISPTATQVWRQDSSTNYETKHFANLTDDYYFYNCVATTVEPHFEVTCNNPYTQEPYSNDEEEQYAYIYDSSKGELSGPIGNYKAYLETIIGEDKITNTRLMAYSEAKKLITDGNTWVYNQAYWLGSLANYTDAIMWIVRTDSPYIQGIDGHAFIGNPEPKSYGIRPVIEIKTCVFTNNCTD